PRERFQVHGIGYMPSPRSKSDLYIDLLPAVNGGRVELLDHPKLVLQLCKLERRTARSGKDSIDHPPGQHDDLINAAAGALTNLIAIQPPQPVFGSYGSGGIRIFSENDHFQKHVNELNASLGASKGR